MRTGLLRHRVLIQRRASVQDAAGQVTFDWADFAQVWAEAQPLRGQELIAAQQAQSSITTRFRIRYRADLDETMRVTWDGRTYGIAAPPIDVDGRRKVLELMCTADARQGV
jgi:SPP1 family predicted phage head-tail adaptor